MKKIVPLQPGWRNGLPLLEVLCALSWGVLSGCASNRYGRLPAAHEGEPTSSGNLLPAVARRWGRKYVLEFGQALLEVDPAIGARVTGVWLAGSANLLTGPEGDPMNFGSTFRLSPQSVWNWPPPPEIDSQPYLTTLSSARGKIVAQGQASALLGAAVTKSFAADSQSQSVAAAYTTHVLAGGRSFAPWEVTRVAPGGLTFFPTGLTSPATAGPFALPVTRDAAGCTWFRYPSARVTASQRLIADGSGGWIAHVAGDTLLVKTFPDISPAEVAPGEGEISIYVDGGGHFVEIEQQGPYRAFAAGQSSTWTVVWYLRKLPAGIVVDIGSESLVRYVKSVVGTRPGIAESH